MLGLGYVFELHTRTAISFPLMTLSLETQILIRLQLEFPKSTHQAPGHVESSKVEIHVRVPHHLRHDYGVDRNSVERLLRAPHVRV